MEKEQRWVPQNVYTSTTIRDAVHIPAMQALFLATSLSALIAWVTYLAKDPGLQAIIKVFITAFLALYVISFVLIGLKWYLLIEHVIGDVNRDGKIGPQPVLKRSQLNVNIQHSPNQGTFHQFDDSHHPELHPLLARMWKGGFTLSHQNVSKGKGKIMSEDDFTNLQKKFVAESLAEWISTARHQNGIRLTPAGEAYFTGLLTEGDRVRRDLAQDGFTPL